MCIEIFKKNMVYDMIKCLFQFYPIESFFNDANFDTRIPEFLLRFHNE